MKTSISKLIIALIAITVVTVAPNALPQYYDDAPVHTETHDSQTSICSAANYNGYPYLVIEDNQPNFTEDQITTQAFESYSDLDILGRCGTAFACLGPETLPSEERGAIGHVKPSGWHTVKYKGVDGNYLYNRCHLIAFSLSGENANEQNLITGTRYMNTEGMLPFEMQTLDYIRDTGNHVMYRATPVYHGNNLVAEGVLLEAYSVEDQGGLSFHVFCYNTQPGVTINYATGESSGPAYED